MAEAASSGGKALTWALVGLGAVVMIGGGVAHFAAPDQFAALVPPFLPAVPVVLVAGIVQIAIGLAMLWPGTRALGGLAFAALCAAYLPLHLWDYVRPDPVFAPPVAATIRVLVQGLFIGAGVLLWRRTR
jgi:uncharacterized membrane protein